MRISFVQRSYFVRLLMNDMCQLNAFLMLISMVQSTLFNPLWFWFNIHSQLEMPSHDE